MSVDPPGVNGTTRCTGRAGQAVSPRAHPLAAANSVAAENSRRRRVDDVSEAIIRLGWMR